MPIRIARPFSAAALLASLLFAGPLGAFPALACGGFFCMNQPIDQSGERIVFIQDGSDVVAHVQIAYQGDARQFSWVVPTPTQPTLGVGSDALFTALGTATQPRFDLALQSLGDCNQPKYNFAPGQSLGALRMKSEDDVKVVSQGQVGPYDSAVIQSNDPGALKRWLKANGYTLPDKLDPLLDPYVAGKYYFVALKLQQDRAAGDLQPITLRYRAAKPGVPIRLTGVAAVPDMDVYVWVLGDDRAIPENYRHATINEARIDWLNAGNNYKEVVSRAVDEAGGQAFVTDYAGDDKVVDLTTFEGPNQNLAKLAVLTDPVAFLRAIQDDGYFMRGSPTAMAFVKRFVPIPKTMKDVWEPGFYSNPEQYREQLRRAGVVVDAAKAARELEETVVKPYHEIREQFKRHSYLTRLYTTMSPDEMNQDPTFRFSPYLPTVSNVHAANGVRDCRRVKEWDQAPIRITLQNGLTFTVTPPKRPRPDWGDFRRGVAPSPAPGPLDTLPAALRVEQLKTIGPPSPIRDNRADIAAALDARVKEAVERPGWEGGGSGCSHRTPAPTNPQDGAGEGLGEGLDTNPSSGPREGVGWAAALVGLLGWRRWRRR